MVGRNESDAAKALANKYPDIFCKNREAAASYLAIVESIKAIHDELSQSDSAGKKHSQTVIDFLDTNIQFHKRDNLFLVTEDIVTFANVCAAQPSRALQQHANNVLKHSKTVINHITDILFRGFEYTNIEALHQLNLERFEKLQSDKENLDANIIHEPTKEQKRKPK